MNKILISTFIFMAMNFSSWAQTIPSAKARPVPEHWQSFSFREISLVSGSPFYKAMETDKAYILSLDIDRLIAGIRTQNGLATKAECYGGWEKGGGGCTYGHYLSACALMYASTGDTRFLDRANQLVSELHRIQDKTPDGWFLGGRDGFAKMQNGDLLLTKPDDATQPWNFNENGNFWYSAHKVLAGLRDAYWYTESNEAKDILLKLGDWICSWSSKTNPDLFQAMLSVEQGGMNEVIADLYSITGDSKYLALAHRFSHTNVVYPVALDEDVLYARHANDQIPKFIGASRIYELSGDKTMKAAAFNFWDMVIRDHTSIIGGNGLYERFGQPGEQSNRLGYSSSETCNTYNMLKLSRRLFTLTGDTKYMDYFERGLYNQILGSQEPETGCVTYFTSLMPGLFKFYSTPENSFWCCVGTGMENHAKYSESIYFHDQDKLLVNLFIPSTLNWKENGLTLQMNTSFPGSDTISIEIAQNKAFSGDIYLRCPVWLKTSPAISCNKRRVDFDTENGYLRLKSNFKTGDKITVVFPQKLYLETMKDDKYLSSVLYGPLVLAAELGDSDLPELHIESPHNMDHFPRPLKNIPYFVGSKTNPESWIGKDASAPSIFVARSAGTPSDISLVPVYKIHHQRFAAYLKIYSPEEFQDLSIEIPDQVAIGDSVSEKAHKLEGEKTEIASFNTVWTPNLDYRMAKENGWFSYELNVNPANKKHFLACRFWGNELANTKFDIWVEGQKLATIDNYKRASYTSLEDVFELPEALWKGKTRIMVLFRPQPGNSTSGLYTLRVQNCPDFRIRPSEN